MKIRTIQWNIGGGKIKKSDAPAEGPYADDGMEHIIETLRREKPDVITLQETHSDDKHSQTVQIAKALGFANTTNDTYGASHIESGQMLGQGIISRWPLTNHEFVPFLNPHRDFVSTKTGKRFITFDNGISSCIIDIEGVPFSIKTLHCIPFTIFGVDLLATEFASLCTDIQQKIRRGTLPFILPGDFNIDSQSLEAYFPEVFADAIQEVGTGEPTNPFGRIIDHVLYKGVRHKKSRVDSSVLTDHYPIISEFEM